VEAVNCFNCINHFSLPR